VLVKHFGSVLFTVNTPVTGEEDARKNHVIVMGRTYRVNICMEYWIDEVKQSNGRSSCGEVTRLNV
jgi:hypothetical protein